MTVDSADDSKISNRTINTNRISNRTYDSKYNRITKLRRSLIFIARRDTVHSGEYAATTSNEFILSSARLFVAFDIIRIVETTKNIIYMSLGLFFTICLVIHFSFLSIGRLYGVYKFGRGHIQYIHQVVYRIDLWYYKPFINMAGVSVYLLKQTEQTLVKIGLQYKKPSCRWDSRPYCLTAPVRVT